MMRATSSFCLGLFTALWLLAPGAAAQSTHGDIQIDTPLSGWRNAGLDQGAQNYLQDVHYPASDVNTPEGQSRYAMIAGQIRRHPKSATDQPAGSPRVPYTLVVNGVAMPLKVDGAGHFSRPYNFGPGSNNVQVISPDGRQQRSATFYEAQTDKQRARVRVVLSWSTDNTDLDLHVITPDGQHAWYGHRDLDNGGALDVDVTDGYGPEIFSSPVAMPGLYYVYVNYYGGNGSDIEGKPAVITVAHITIITDENTPDAKQQTFVVPMREAGELTQVARFIVPGQNR